MKFKNKLGENKSLVTNLVLCFSKKVKNQKNEFSLKYNEIELHRNYKSIIIVVMSSVPLY
jgi:ribosomal protein S17E